MWDVWLAHEACWGLRMGMVKHWGACAQRGGLCFCPGLGEPQLRLSTSIGSVAQFVPAS